jgi:hypothetical protein
MVPDNAHMLPTVLSRAIKLQISNSKELMESSTDFKSVSSPQDLLAFLKQNRDISGMQNEKKFIEQTIERHLTHSNSSPESFLNLEKLLKILADDEIYSDFNNSKLARMTSFFS